jgi:hypothetical protein
MTESEATLSTLYDWVVQCESQLDELKSAFPEWAKNDRTRLLMSFSCLRVTLEVRLKPRFPKRRPTRPTGRTPGDAPSPLPF